MQIDEPTSPARLTNRAMRYHDLRTQAEKSLGAGFNAKDFHAVVIDNGAMPLAVLEQVVVEWIARGGGRNMP